MIPIMQPEKQTEMEMEKEKEKMEPAGEWDTRSS